MQWDFFNLFLRTGEFLRKKQGMEKFRNPFTDGIINILIIPKPIGFRETIE